MQNRESIYIFHSVSVTVKWDHVLKSDLLTTFVKKIINDQNSINEEDLVWYPANQVVDKLIHEDGTNTQNIVTIKILYGPE